MVDMDSMLLEQQLRTDELFRELENSKSDLSKNHTARMAELQDALDRVKEQGPELESLHDEINADIKRQSDALEALLNN